MVKMKTIFFALAVFLFAGVSFEALAQTDPVYLLEKQLAASNDSVYFQTAIALSDAYVQAEKYEKAARVAGDAFAVAARMHRKDLMAIARNREAKAIVKNRKANKLDRLAALAKFGESLELLSSSKVENDDLERDNINNLQESGEKMAHQFDRSEVQKVITVAVDSVKKELAAIPQVFIRQNTATGAPEQVFGGNLDYIKEKQAALQQKIMEMNLARMENEMKRSRSASSHAASGMSALDELKVLPDLKERWMPVKAEIEKQFAIELSEVEKMDDTEAKEKLLLAEYKSKYDSLAYLHILDSINLEKKELALRQQEAEARQEQTQKSLMMMGSGSTLILAFLFLFGFLNQKKTNKLLSLKNEKILHEQARSEELLLNILPAKVAQELKQFGTARAHRYETATVIFSDFQNFTGIAEELAPEKLIADLDYCFKAFDRITEKYQLEKIKTIGDAYLCAGGVPSPDPEHASRAVQAALEMQAFLKNWKQEKIANGERYFQARIGIHSGPVIAGVVGVKKFAYDIWGDTVNIAARVESSGEPGRVNISGHTYDLVKHRFKCAHRGKIEAKNKGEIDMYFIDEAA